MNTGTTKQTVNWRLVCRYNADTSERTNRNNEHVLKPRILRSLITLCRPQKKFNELRLSIGQPISQSVKIHCGLHSPREFPTVHIILNRDIKDIDSRSQALNAADLPKLSSHSCPWCCAFSQPPNALSPENQCCGGRTYSKESSQWHNHQGHILS